MAWIWISTDNTIRGGEREKRVVPSFQFEKTAMEGTVLIETRGGLREKLFSENGRYIVIVRLAKPMS